MKGIGETSREERGISRSILRCNQLEFLPELTGFALTVNTCIAITDCSALLSARERALNAQLKRIEIRLNNRQTPRGGIIVHYRHYDGPRIANLTSG